MAEEVNMDDVEATEDGAVEQDENENNMSEEEDAGEQHEFEIIDQVDSDEDEDGNGRRKDNDNGNEQAGDKDESSDTDFDDSQLHEMLEKGIDKDTITAKKTESNEAIEGQPLIRHKIILQEMEVDPFDILPEGWVCAFHNSGMPVYLHKESRVCTMARPYYLGSASTRKHDIPISAIPCLNYRSKLKAMDEEREKMDNTTEAGGNASQEQKISSEMNKESTAASVETSIPSPEQKCILGQPLDQEHTPPSLSLQFDVSPPTTDVKPPHKMWMVTQDSSGQCPSQREPEELHTGKTNHFTNEIAQVDPNSQLTTSHSNNDNNTDSPRSPGGENIAVKYDSSTPLKFESLDGGYYSVFQENDSRDKDISIRKDLTDSFDYKCPVPKEPIMNEEGEIPEEPSVDVNVGDSGCPVADSSQHNIVVEESSTNVDTSELVTSNTSTISNIKRKIEDRKRKGAKQRKLMDGTIEDSPPSNENNIAVDVLNPQVPEPLRIHGASVRVLSAEERAKSSVLDVDAVHNYCAKLFLFKTIVVKKYKTWRERRAHIIGKNRANRPKLPSDTKLIACPIAWKNQSPGHTGKKKEFILNPSGKSYLCILHEYMQRTLKIQPTYVFKELENPKTPYGATVTINNIEYGTGLASSKKMAKQEAAKETLKILIPDICSKISDQVLKSTVSDLSFFDEIQVEDPRIHALGNKVGQPSPFQILRECLRRNFGMGTPQCTVNTTALKNQKCEFTLNVGKHSATIVAKNKRDGKQLAAQAILAKLHPHIPSWGSLLRLYATNVEKPMEKVEEMNEIKTHVPNKAVLENLRKEMRKLHQQKEAIQSKGKMLISTKDLPNKMSCVDL